MHPHNTLIITVSLDKEMKVWNPRTKKCIFSFAKLYYSKSFFESLNNIACFDDIILLDNGNTVITLACGNIAIWNIAQKKLLNRFSYIPPEASNSRFGLISPKYSILVIAIGNEGELIGGNRDGTICFWDLKKGIQTSEITAAHEKRNIKIFTQDSNFRRDKSFSCVQIEKYFY